MELHKIDYEIKLSIVCKKEYRNKYYSNEKFKVLTKNLSYGTVSKFPRNYFLFNHMFKELQIPSDLKSIAHAYYNVNPEMTDFTNHITSIYENIYNRKIKKYCIDSYVCDGTLHGKTFKNYSLERDLTFYEENKNSLIPKTKINKCDLFYGIVMLGQKPTPDTMTSCINSILKTIKLGLKYGKKYCIIAFWGYVRYEHILTLLAVHYDVKIFKTYYSTVMALMFTPKPDMDKKIIVLINHIIKYNYVASFIETIPLPVHHIVHDIEFHNKMLSQHQHVEQRIVNSLCDSNIQISNYQELLNCYFEPIKQYLGPSTLIHHPSIFIKSYLQQFNNKNFIFIGIPDLLNNIGKFYVVYIKYRYICIQNYHHNPKLLLEQFGTELKFNIIHENKSYILIKRSK